MTATTADHETKGRKGRRFLAQPIAPKRRIKNAGRTGEDSDPECFISRGEGRGDCAEIISSWSMGEGARP